MNFRFLRCFVFAFACVIVTGGVSIFGGNALACEKWQYSENGECKNCPLHDKIGTQNILLYDYTNYSFDQSGEGITSCTIIGLNLSESACGEGTNIVYKYDENTQKYILDTENYIVVPEDGFFQLYESNDSRITVFSGQRHCGRVCPTGTYLNENEKKCISCPLDGTNAEGKVGDNKRFKFLLEVSDDTGITRCKVKLDPEKDNCGKDTNVVYVYDPVSTDYIRVEDEDFQVVPGAKSLVVDKEEIPAANDMEKPFCKKCGDETPYNVNGKCVACSSGYYKYYTDDSDSCKICPAGSYCPGDGTVSQCPANTYAEEGLGSCKLCPMGYFTTENADGLCEQGGVGCVARSACKFVMSKLCINKNCFTLNNVKIESTNTSVIKIVSDQ